LHFHQELLVKADSAKGAKKRAEGFLGPHGDNGTGVFDYYVIGGRWEGAHDAVDDLVKPATEKVAKRLAADKAPDIFSYKDNPELFLAQIKSMLDSRNATLVEAKEGLLHFAKKTGMSMEDILDFPRWGKSTMGEGPDMKISMVGYNFRKASKILSDSYCTNSYFWDVENETGYFSKETLEEIEKEPGAWWLVTVDLHN